ncbi:MAG: hypothetical protein M1526_04810 [Candidatus Thermoplasmatota archaeon]|jgi:iron-sulfur cluster repair protein YtfE (RIC family)|nr:hypothetical protein [Candidatus Thermoplasmatota archaeon]MCL5681376.1 hypothetical protein [Candidatus Thermoplasmatota archaeon]
MNPRKMEAKELIEKLKEEHNEIPALIDDAILTYQIGNLSGAFPVIAQVREVIAQHTIDEESTILKILLDKLGKDNSKEYIEIFQQHVQITKAVDAAVESTYTGWTETVNLLNNLKQMTAEHHKKEEEIVFPKVLSLL